MAADETRTYPEGPWYLGGSLDVSVFLVPEHELPPFALPRGRRPLMVGRRVVVGVASVRYVPGGVLAYDELLVAIPTLGAGGAAVTIPQIWVNSDASRRGGRELWGIPKELADFSRSGSVTTMSVDGRDVMSVRARRGSPLLPGMRQIPLPVLQVLDGVRTRSVNRVISKVSGLRTSWRFAADGPLGYLRGRRPIMNIALHDGSVVFGMDVERSAESGDAAHPADRGVAVVTGGARGIGYQVARDLGAAGYTVVIGDLDEAETVAAAERLGRGTVGLRLDITDADLVSAVVDRIETEVGPISVWVNNAGIMPTGRFAEQDADVAQKTIDVDYTALVRTTSAVLPRMMARRRGTIVNLASATGLKPLAGLAVYSGAKAAVIGFSDALRRELRGTGVDVHVILPHLVSTPMGAGITPPKVSPAVTPEQVSRAVVDVIGSSRFAVTVPRVLSPVLRFSRLLPTAVQDWLDDVIGTDRIGLGGDPEVRARYLREVDQRLSRA